MPSRKKTKHTKALHYFFRGLASLAFIFLDNEYLCRILSIVFNSFDFVLNTMVVMVVCEAASAIAST